MTRTHRISVIFWMIAVMVGASLVPAQAPAMEGAASRAASRASTPTIVGVSHFAMRDGLRIHLWQKCVTGGEATAAATGKVAILVHGSTWSGRPDFDLQIRDYSLMDFLAGHGYDVWAIDIHGYGASDHTEKDWSDTASAARDLDAATEYVCALRKVAQVKLLGWSWGTLITGMYASAHPQRVARLILYGPVWKGRIPQGTMPLPTTQYRVNTAENAASDFIPGQFEADVVTAYVEAALKVDPKSPNGTIVDCLSKLPLVKPEEVTVPTMIIRPEKDFASTPAEMLAFFGRLKTQDKTYVVLPDGGHAAMLETGHRRFQSVVLGFFDRP